MVLKFISLSREDTYELIYDIVKFMTYAVVIHVLLTSIDGIGELFNEKILKVLLYTCISMIIYHIFVKKLVKHILSKKVKDDSI